MRAVKSVLVMAGSLKRQNPDKNEDVVLIRALRDSNLPKFLAEDAVLFQAILQDLFPGIEIPAHDYGNFQAEITKVMKTKQLYPLDSMVKKVIEFYETMIVRHGVMLVGPTGGGKTTIYQILADTLTNLHNSGENHPFYRPVHTYILNPKSITMEELYGGVSKLTMEWHDGLMALTVRIACNDTSEDHQWVICDGPVDALWIENMNTVLDDNKMLCLANSERIKLTPYIHMVFEVQDLAVASPATVSRCGMVYIDPEELKWMPYVHKWLKKWTEKLLEESSDYLMDMFARYVEKGLQFIKKNCVQTILQSDICKVTSLCKLLESLLFYSETPINFYMDTSKLNPLLCICFIFSFLWGLGGNIIDSNWDAFDTFIRNIFDNNGDAKLPVTGDLWSCYVDFESRRLEFWEKIVPNFKYDKNVPFFEILVPTVDTVRYGHLLQKLLQVKHPVLFTGDTGVGKSVIARTLLNNISEKADYVPVFINFSAQTSSQRTQEMIESKLEKKRKNALGAPIDKRVIIFIDDLNMPKLDTYGSQPPIELLRQLLDFGGLYDRERLCWKEILDVTLSAACAPPGGGRNPVTPRLMRHFTMLSIPPPSENSLQHMFMSILNGFLRDFTPAVRNLTDSIVTAAIDIYNRMKTDLLPTPTKSHYIFNLRDLSKCIQGILQCDPINVRDGNKLFRLFCHESMRVFHDRLINTQDKDYFYTIMSEIASKYFGEVIDPETLRENPILFGDFLSVTTEREDRLYEEFTDIRKIQSNLQEYLDEFNMQSPKEMKLVFFLDAVQHVTRIARILRQQRGNALLVGVGGTGKQSLTRLASHICNYRCFQIELTRGYDYASFHADLIKLYDMAGAKNENTVFLFTDTQIVVEEFLEDINNILNSGEVPNLLATEDLEKLIIACRPDAKEVGIPEGSRDQIYDFCINRVRNNLHIVLCMSPVGNSFRTRCRTFPSLVNCCTINWLTEWPKEALYSVARSFFEEIDLGKTEMKDKIATMCVEIHTSVTTMAERFYNELKRHYYTTPTSYLELINLYLSMLNGRNRSIKSSRERVQNGLIKLLETNELVAKMKVELVALEPELKMKSAHTIEIMEKLVLDQEKVDAVRKVVVADEALAKAKAEETQNIAAEAQSDLDAALPALEGAIKALDALDKQDISEIRVFTNPPELVQTVLEAVCILMNQRTDWSTAKAMLGEPGFLKRMVDYDKDHISDASLKRLKKYIDNPKFQPEHVEKVSKACRSMCMWVRAMDLYAHIYRNVEPKRQRLQTAQEELDAVMETLKEKQQKLADVEDQIAQLQKTYDNSLAEKQTLERNIAQTAARLKRASKLTTALADEQGRWKENIMEFTAQLGNVIGDVFVSAACVAYYGAFTSVYRKELVDGWISHCVRLEIPISDGLTLVKVLADPFEIRQWNTDGLPRDQVSIENAILVTKGHRWPLMIDPQEQANCWIRNKEMKNNLQIIKLSDTHLLQTLENCIRIGIPVLIEDIGETLDPALEPILLKQTFQQGGRLMIRLGDSDIEYDKNFRLYMTTKISNPHYLPEVCIKVTIINFTVTRSGLEDQILSDVVRLERPDLEEQRNTLIVRINADKNQLKASEDRILKLLFESEGNILDNEELINILNESKVTSGYIKQRLEETETTEMNISAAREKYRPVAARGSVMYFVVADMAEVDPMYQFSLKYFKQLFNYTIEASERSDDLQQRLQTCLVETTRFIYKNVSRALFEKHKLMFSLILCTEIMKQEQKITSDEWNFFLRGGGAMEMERDKKPNFSWLNQHTWNIAADLGNLCSAFSNLTTEITKHLVYVTLENDKVCANSEILTTKTDDDESAADIEGCWDEKLTSFQKLIFIKAFQEEKVK
ncbi:DNAH [Acanthosepion pharaonis]|uniref:DNAH n=1 Tax=Acanthosepion pharaonis TaxID=158019 RepID=A0A812ESG9_ACAPH|nr:DNAH [Sepia pharaonis]